MSKQADDADAPVVEGSKGTDAFIRWACNRCGHINEEGFSVEPEGRTLHCIRNGCEGKLKLQFA